MGWYGWSPVFVFSSLYLCLALDPRLTHSPQQWAIVRSNHSGLGLTDEELRSIAQMGDYNHFKSMLAPILIPRVADTPGSMKVRKHLVDEMKRLQWHVEEDQFYSSTPLKQQVSFTNVIATLDPTAPRRLVLACHYDSLLTKSGRFVGATDSAVPCAQMLSLANDLKAPLSRLNLLDEEVTLQLIFFDGEEAFVRWSRTDSTYGSRHLAQKLQKQPYTDTGATNVNHLHRIDLFVLLDLIGVSDPTFYSYFRDSESWYSRMASIEFRLRNLNLMKGRKAMFKKDSWYNPGIEDDHIPFLERGVPILHLIPYPFPRGWHQDSDDEKSLDPSTIQNFNAILRAFVTDYLHLDLA